MSYEFSNDDSDWDAMQEEGACGYTYASEVDIGFTCSSEVEEDIVDVGQMFIRDVPPGMTAEGIRSICLRVADPLTITFLQDGNSCFVTFNTTREAKLAVRDINDRSPYFMTASLADPDLEFDSPDNESESSNSSGHNLERPDGGSSNNERPEHLLTDDDNTIDDMVVRRRPLEVVPPYFKYRTDYDYPSLIMRQMVEDFVTRRECVALGRGYLNLSNTVPTVGGRLFFTRSTRYYRRVRGFVPPPINERVVFESDDLEYKLSRSKTCCSAPPGPNPNKLQSSVLDLFHPDETGSIEIYTHSQDSRLPCLITLDRYINAFHRLHTLMKYQGVPTSADKGEKVLVRKRDGDLARAIVLSKSNTTYRVALIDFAETFVVEEVYEMPESLQRIMSFGCLATYLGPDLLTLSTIKFRVRERRQFGTWLCDILSTRSTSASEIMVEEWFPPVNLTYIPLQPRCTVVISAYLDMRTVFVRRVDQPWRRNFVELNNDVASYTLTAKNYKRVPKHGEICSARYGKDECYYRGFVRSISSETARIYFVDYGNEHETSVRDLCYLPIAAKLNPCFAVRVVLSNVMEFSSLEAVEYLNKLVAYETELVLTYDPDKPNQVILREKSTRNVVNNVIAYLATPKWERDLGLIRNPGRMYDLDFIDELHFRCGTYEDILILSFDEGLFCRDGTFWATLNRGDYLGHLNGELKQTMTEYCNSQNYGYRPRNGELCHVKIEGQWYRSVSMVDKNIICQVFLLDFGVVAWVETIDIRKFHESFAEMPALAIQCKVTDFKRYSLWQKRLYVEYLRRMQEKIVKNVLVTGYNDGIYFLRLPFAERFLLPQEPGSAIVRRTYRGRRIYMAPQ